MPQELEAVVLNQEMQREVIRLKPTAPGRLAGEFATADPGSYMIQIVEKAGGQAVASQTTGLTVAFSPEYGMPRDGEKELLDWLKTGGGTLIAKPAEAFAGSLPDKWDTQSISEWLLMLAALLWPFDVAARRLQLPEHWWARRPKPRATSASGRQAVLSRLGEKRTGAKQKQGSQRVSTTNPAVSDDAVKGRTREANAQATKTSQKQESANETAAADKTFNRLLEAKKRRTK
jgi:hypothetical protein